MPSRVRLALVLLFASLSGCEPDLTGLESDLDCAGAASLDLPAPNCRAATVI